jgi:hypothetical protein
MSLNEESSVSKHSLGLPWVGTYLETPHSLGITLHENFHSWKCPQPMHQISFVTKGYYGFNYLHSKFVTTFSF